MHAPSYSNGEILKPFPPPASNLPPIDRATSGETTEQHYSVKQSVFGKTAEKGWAPSPGFSEKTDFAWVPAACLLRAMRDSRNRSPRKVVVKLGGCRYLRLFHKVSLYFINGVAVIVPATFIGCLLRDYDSYTI